MKPFTKAEKIKIAAWCLVGILAVFLFFLIVGIGVPFIVESLFG